VTLNPPPPHFVEQKILPSQAISFLCFFFWGEGGREGGVSQPVLFPVLGGVYKKYQLGEDKHGILKHKSAR